MRAHAVLIALTLLVACDGDSSSSSDATPEAPSPTSCDAGGGLVGDRCVPAGFEECPDGAGPSGASCGESALSCAPGEVAFFGATSCTPIGPGACAPGFTRDPSGFGCTAVLTNASCSGATRPRLGETSCVPVGDCSAPFPPNGATYFVDDSFTAGQIDTAHFATIQAAIAAAPMGATIAIEEGSYLGAITLTKSVTLAGRCAAKVTLTGGASVSTPGLEVVSKIKASASGMTINDFEVGVSAGAGAEVNLDGLVIEGNRRIGVLAADATTQVTATGIVVRHTLPDSSERFGHGLAAGFDATISLDDSAILDSREIGAGAQKNGHLKVRRSIIANVAQRAGNLAYGWGVGTQSGGQATVTESAILDTFVGGIVAVEANSTTRLERSYVRGVRPGPATKGSDVAAAALAQVNGSIHIEGSTLTKSDQYGVLTNEGAKATVISSVVRDFVGNFSDGGAIAIGLKSTATLKDIAILATSVAGLTLAGTVDANQIYVSDVTATALAVRFGTTKLTRFSASNVRIGKDGDNVPFGAMIHVLDGGSLEASEVLVRKAVGLGVIATDPKTKLTLRRGAITDTIAAGERGDPTGFGLTAKTGAEITVEDLAIVRSRDLGVHIADPETIATLRGVAIVDTLPNGAEERARAINVQGGAVATLSRVLARGGEQVGISIVGANTRAVIEDSIISGVKKTSIGFGHGVSVTESGSLVMTHSIVREHAGVGLVFANASGSVASSVVRANPVGVHTQDGVNLIEAPNAPAELIANQVVFTSDTRFEDNLTKVGSGVLPLPAAIISFSRPSPKP